MAGWSTSSSVFFALATVGIAGSGHDASAGFIGQSDITNPILTDLDNLGIAPNPPAPLTVGIYTFTTDDGFLRYANFGLNNSQALGDNTDLGFINITLKKPVR